MELSLETVSPGPVSTEGQLGIDGVFECYTLELPYTDGAPGSAIPAGRFLIKFEPSPKFLSVVTNPAEPQAYRDFVIRYAHAMPHIICPPRSLIMFHWANQVHDLNGCVGVGKTRDVNFIGQSRDAFAEFYEKIREPVLNGNCFVTVSR
jgi:hypothetical protein